ncbi:hypothetical protein NELLIE_46 [Arthrobacter phage Nellie]|uniref:Uncharacterized protein n=4 Tax=Jasminevirus adat TaxID=2560299 RepID=A0A249XN93_9CAUD|nr:hypothetical protein FDI47_gp46 [Arthrobacter phage Adat]ASZ72617.1 hypothetical protein ADAT_46 [Arthrobacter phage Adat]ASZ73199.1 hypothetical protein GURGLEFERB_46 [Arthrobacter phage GurgleFerb]ASZ73764.1 hypothetical protein NELLIE_46 [Arthrobacter phage Nellie]AXH43734.1 hypothetical protein SEA_BRAD_46 [Arthrobacter phage Brad]
MATRTTIIWCCDNCNEEALPMNKEEDMQHGWHYPENWAQVDMSVRDGMVSDMLLCNKCISVMLNALKRRHKEDGE